METELAQTPAPDSYAASFLPAGFGPRSARVVADSPNKAEQDALINLRAALDKLSVQRNNPNLPAELRSKIDLLCGDISTAMSNPLGAAAAGLVVQANEADAQAAQATTNHLLKAVFDAEASERAETMAWFSKLTSAEFIRECTTYDRQRNPRGIYDENGNISKEAIESGRVEVRLGEDGKEHYFVHFRGEEREVKAHRSELEREAASAERRAREALKLGKDTVASVIIENTELQLEMAGAAPERIAEGRSALQTRMEAGGRISTDELRDMQARGGLTQEEIRTALARNRRIDRASLGNNPSREDVERIAGNERAYQRVASEMQPPQQQAPATVKLDLNGDNKVDNKDTVILAHAVDKDHDGKITGDELKNFLSTQKDTRVTIDAIAKTLRENGIKFDAPDATQEVAGQLNTALNIEKGFAQMKASQSTGRS